MPDHHNLPLPLDYATPKLAEPAAPSPALPRHPLTRGTLPPSDATSLVLQTLDRPDMAAASHALDQHHIPYCLTESPPAGPAAPYKRPLLLLVRPEHAPRAAELTNQILTRRHRAKSLLAKPEQSSTWPDPLRPNGSLW